MITAKDLQTHVGPVDIKSWKDKFLGNTCYILGNGPSLKDIDLWDLEYPTFGTNRIYLSGWQPNFFVTVNPLIYEQFFDEILGMEDTFFFFNQHMPDNKLVNDYSMIETSGDAAFTFGNPEDKIWEGCTVTYVAMQLAYYMGFRRVILLGVDHDFGKYNDLPHKEIMSMGPDENHFHPDYFGKGIKWNGPDLPNSEYAYTLAKHAFEAAGGIIINASTYSKLRVFDQVPLNHLNNDYTVLSAIVSAYNAENYLEGCLEDLMRQTLEPEIVVVCKLDSEEFKIAKSYEEGYENIIVVPTQGTPTVYGAWNLGLEYASGEYITNANTDDRHHEQAFELQVQVLDARPEIDLVYYNSFISWEDDTFESWWEKHGDKIMELGFSRVEGEPALLVFPDYDYRAICRQSICGPHPMWRANLHQKHGKFINEFKVAGDYEFFLRAADERNYFHMPQFLGVYNAHMDGVELGNPIETLDESSAAIVMNSDPRGIDVYPTEDGEHAQFCIGNSHAMVAKKALYDILGQ